MLRTRTIPCLLLRNNGLVKTIRFKDYRYIGDPINAVRIFNEKEADELIFLDISATVEKREPSYDLIEDIASEAFMPFSYGGGIRNLDTIRRLFRLGIEKVIINSYAIEDPLFIKRAADINGSQSIIVSIDAKRDIKGRYEVFRYSEGRTLKIDPVEFAVKIEKHGAGEIFLNSVDRDGTMTGYDNELIRNVSSAVQIPVIACGGAGTAEDFKSAVLSGASAIAAGSMFVFQGKRRAVLISYASEFNVG